MKKNKLIALSFLMATVMILSAVVTVSAATTTVYPSEACYVWNSKPAQFMDSTAFVLDGYSGNHRVGFMKLDFSSVDLSAYPGMQLKLTGYKNQNAGTDGKEIDIKISIIPDALEDTATVSTLTYNAASTAGWIDAGDLIGTISGTMVNAAYPMFYSTNILDAIKADIAKNDRTVVLKIENNITENGYGATYYANMLTNGYTNERVQIVAMTQAAVDEGKAKAQADADALSIANTAELGGTITLPTTGPVNGSKITWKSDSAYINADTGAVASKVGFADEIVTLTATVNYKGMVATKAFQVTLAGSNVQAANDCVTIRGQVADDNKTSLNKYLVINQQTSDNRQQGIMRFDITDVKKSIDNLEDISLRLTMCFVKPGTQATIDYKNGRYFLSILPDNAWTTDTMTLKYAIENNLISGATKVGSTGTVATVEDNTIVFEGLKDDIKAFIANNPTATSISFLLTTEETSREDSVYFYVMGNGEHKATEATQPLLIGETAKRFTAANNNGTVTFTYNVDSAKYPNGINMPATFFAAEYDSTGKLVKVAFEADANSKLTSGETTTLTISGYTSGNSINAMVFNNLSEIMPMQGVTPFGN